MPVQEKEERNKRGSEMVVWERLEGGRRKRREGEDKVRQEIKRVVRW